MPAAVHGERREQLVGGARPQPATCAPVDRLRCPPFVQDWGDELACCDGIWLPSIYIRRSELPGRGVPSWRWHGHRSACAAAAAPVVPSVHPKLLPLKLPLPPAPSANQSGTCLPTLKTGRLDSRSSACRALRQGGAHLRGQGWLPAAGHPQSSPVSSAALPCPLLPCPALPCAGPPTAACCGARWCRPSSISPCRSPPSPLTAGTCWCASIGEASRHDGVPTGPPCRPGCHRCPHRSVCCATLPTPMIGTPLLQYHFNLHAGVFRVYGHQHRGAPGPPDAHERRRAPHLHVSCSALLCADPRSAACCEPPGLPCPAPPWPARPSGPWPLLPPGLPPSWRHRGAAWARATTALIGGWMASSCP